MGSASSAARSSRWLGPVSPNRSALVTFPLPAARADSLSSSRLARGAQRGFVVVEHLAGEVVADWGFGGIGSCPSGHQAPLVTEERRLDVATVPLLGFGVGQQPDDDSGDDLSRCPFVLDPELRHVGRDPLGGDEARLHVVGADPGALQLDRGGPRDAGEMLTSDPVPRETIPGSTSRLMCSGAITLAYSCFSSSSIGVSRNRSM